MDAFRAVDVMRVTAGGRATTVDRTATEEPLEIRLHNRPFAVIMRTPGADLELAAGFLLAERVLSCADDLGLIEHCTDPSAEHPENIVNVTLASRSEQALDAILAARRQVTTNSSCGLCGRLTIESLRVDAPPFDAACTLPSAVLLDLPGRLRSAQTIFNETGGLHAAGVFARDGSVVEFAEDVGRHNAVDKVIGRLLIRESLPLSEHVLFVSGRTSFEIVQKAVLAGIPFVASVSAPSSLAVELASELGVTLAGFVRGDTFNVYAHPERISD
jgi:FdhD protein